MKRKKPKGPILIPISPQDADQIMMLFAEALAASPIFRPHRWDAEDLAAVN